MRQRTVMIAAFLALCPWLSAIAEPIGTTRVVVVPVVQDDRSAFPTPVITKAVVEAIEKFLGRYVVVVDKSKLRDSSFELWDHPFREGDISSLLGVVNKSPEMSASIDAIVFSSVGGILKEGYSGPIVESKVNLRAIEVGTSRVLGMASQEKSILLRLSENRESVIVEEIKDPAEMAAHDLVKILLKAEATPPRPYRVK
ncbi:MAG: hypothetical protein HQL33_01870 [Alphaproteobacteria bacterium]|nr:hypothetical protein [Alphaproteobacteria bacterium]